MSTFSNTPKYNFFDIFLMPRASWYMTYMLISSKVISTILKMPICNGPAYKKDISIWGRGNLKVNSFAVNCPILINFISLCRAMIILSKNIIKILKNWIKMHFIDGVKLKLIWKYFFLRRTIFLYWLKSAFSWL